MSVWLLGALVGCGSGGLDPPDSFGAVESSWFGCPDLAGDYAWPPVAGQYSDGGFPKTSTWPVAIWEGRYQLRVEEKNGRVTVKTFKVYEDEDGQEQLARQPAFSEYDGSQFTCKGGMLRITPTGQTPQSDFGGAKINRGYRLAKLKDGGLAVAEEIVSEDRTEALVRWGEQSAGRVDLPNKTFIRWSKLSSKR